MHILQAVSSDLTSSGMTISSPCTHLSESSLYVPCLPRAMAIIVLYSFPQISIKVSPREKYELWILLVVMDWVFFCEEKGVTRYKSFFIHFSFKLLIFISIQNTQSLWSVLLTGDVSTITKWHDQCHSFPRSVSCSLLRLSLFVLPGYSGSMRILFLNSPQ